VDNIADRQKNEMQSGNVSRELHIMTKALGYKGKAKGTIQSKVEEEVSSPKPTRHQEGR